MCVIRLGCGGRRHALPAAQGMENILDTLDQGRALADQLVAAAGAGMVDGTGNRIDLAALLGGQARGDQRAAGRAGLDHQHAERQAADDAVAPRKVAGLRRAVQRQFGDQRATLLGNAPGQTDVALRVDPLQAGTQHRDRCTASFQRALVGGTVDTQGQAAGDHEATTGQAAGKGLGGIQPRSRGAPTADHGQLRTLQQPRITGDEQQRRGVVQLGQQGGVGGVVPHQQGLARLLQPAQSGRGPLADVCATPGLGTAAGKTQRAPRGGRRAEGGGGAAKSFQQAAKAPRTELRQAVQAQARLQFGGGRAVHGDRP